MQLQGINCKPKRLGLVIILAVIFVLFIPFMSDIFNQTSNITGKSKRLEGVSYSRTIESYMDEKDLQNTSLTVTENTIETDAICKLNIPKNEDSKFEFVKQCVNVLNTITSKYGVKWIGWGESTLALLRTGALHITTKNYPTLKSIPEVREVDLSFEVQLIANDVNKIHNVWTDLAHLTSTFSSDLICELNNPEDTNQGCSVIIPVNRKPFKFVVNGPLVFDETKKELWMSNNWLYMKQVLPLDRVLPPLFASYYGLAIPVPNDPVFTYSHVMPLKGSPAAAERRYEYGQGCYDLVIPSYLRSLQKNKLEDTDNLLRYIEQCGTSLNKEGFASFYPQCNKTATKEQYETLNNTLKSTAPNTPVFVETFPHVIVLHRGTGQYKLDKPNGHGGRKTWSQYGQDKYIDKLFEGKREGFFIEIGGLDGEAHSNSLFFEKERDWDGLLVEANPYTFQMMLGRNRKCYMTNACVSSSNVTELTFRIAGGITSSNELMTQQHRSRQSKEIGSRKGVPLWTHEGENVKVHCKSLNTIMDKIGNRRIDFFSLDVDGSEMFILNSLDWDRLDIDVIMIEMAYRQEEIRQFIYARGFERIAQLPIDDVFRKVKSNSSQLNKGHS